MNKNITEKGCQDLGTQGPQFKKYELGYPEKTGNIGVGREGKEEGRRGRGRRTKGAGWSRWGKDRGREQVKSYLY